MLRTVVINLERRPSRLGGFLMRAQQAIPGAQLQIFKAVDGQELGPEPQILELFKDNDFSYRSAVIACALSHLRLWQALLHDPGLHSLLILEDDVYFASDFFRRWAEIAAILPRTDQGLPAFDLFFLGGPRSVRALNPLVGIAEPDIGRGTYAYVVTKPGAARLLEAAKQNGIRRALDWFMAERFASMTALTSLQPLCESPINLNSDIQADRRTLFDSPPRKPVLDLSHGLLRVKPVCDWCKPEELIAQWNKMSYGGAAGRHFRLVPEDEADLYLVINRCPDRYITPRSLYFPMEPSEGRTGWGYWRSPNPRHFFRLFGHETERNICEWHLGQSRDELLASTPEKTKVLSSVTSAKAILPGHRQRLSVLKALEGAGVQFDLFGRSNDAGFASYRGSLPTYHKEDGLAPYRYTVACENSAERGYVTEKLWDAILCECLTFYWGCPNITDYISADSFVWIDIYNLDSAVNTIKKAIEDNLWERRLSAIREAKRKILDELSFFPHFDAILRGLAQASQQDS